MSEIVPDLTQEGPSEAAFPERPWLTILIRPRTTIRAIVDSDPRRYVIPLAILGGIGNAFINHVIGSNEMLITLSQTFGLPIGLLLTVIAGGFIGLIGLFLFGALFTWAGSGFDGKASSEDVRAAMAWSGVPAIILLFFVPLLLLPYGSERITPLESSSGTYILFAFVATFLYIWWGILFWKCYAEVQQFSLLKAFITIVLGFVAVFFLMLILGFLFGIVAAFLGF